MKVKVISVFKDKNTNEVYPLDKELEVSKERYEEIKEFVEIINPAKKNTDKKNYEVED